MRGFSGIVLILFVAILVVVGAVSFYLFNKQQMASINSFEDCAKKYSVMESYPAQCNTPDGKHFVQGLTDEENSELIPAEDVPSQHIYDQDSANLQSEIPYTPPSDWVTHSNSKSKYTVQLPKTTAYCETDVSVDIYFDNPGGCPSQTAADLNIYIHSEEPIYTLYEQMMNNPYSITSKEENIVLGNQKIKKISYFLMQDYPEYHLSKGLYRVRYIRQINNVWFDLTDYHLNNDKLIELIISSLKIS